MKSTLKNILRTALVAAIFVIGEGVMWGDSTYYARGIVTVNTNETGAGTVYVEKEESDSPQNTQVTFDGKQDSSNSPATVNISSISYLTVDDKTGDDFHFVSWKDDSSEIGTNPKNQKYEHTFTISSSSTDDKNPATQTSNVVAVFERNKITGTFDKNKGSGSSSRSVKGDVTRTQYFYSGQEGKIDNDLSLQLTVTYEKEGGKFFDNNGQEVSDSYFVIDRFSRWKVTAKDEKEKYSAGQYSFTGNNEEDGTELNFKAIWVSVENAVTPPTKNQAKDKNLQIKKGDVEFLGWWGDKNKNGESVQMYNADGGRVEFDILSERDELKLTAHWGDPFYASMSLEKTEKGASGDPSADYGILSSDSKNSDLTFNLTAAAPADGYHFTGWTNSSGEGKEIDFASSSELTTKATVKSSQTAGESNANQYKARANYEINTYFAKLVAEDCVHGSVTVVEESTKSSPVSGGFVEFELSIQPEDGFHLEDLTFTPATGEKIIRDGTTYARVKLPEGENYGVGNALSYSIKATFAEDKYNARLTVATSKAGTGSDTTGVAKVKNDTDKYVTDPVVKSATTSGEKVAFDILAIPKTGYQLLGWATSDNSTEYVTIKDNQYTVNVHTTEGQTLEYTLFAVFGHGKYTVKFDGNGAASGSMEDEEFTHGTAQKLTKLGYTNDFTLTFNTQGGEPIEPVTKSRFTGWSFGENTYADEEELDLTVEHGSELEFKATWAEQLEFILPTPSKKAEDDTPYIFLGWYDSDGHKVGDAGAEVSINASQTLFARWRQYDIIVKANYGEDATKDRAVFIVSRSGSPAIKYRISVPIGGTSAVKVLNDVAPGEWTVTPADKWAWKYETPVAQTASLTEGTTEFKFTFTLKSTEKKHDETSKTKGYDTTN